MSIHLFGSTERRLKRLPSRDTLVHIVVCVHPSQGIIGELHSPALKQYPWSMKVAAYRCFLRAFEKICLPSVAVARPLVQDKDPCEVTKIANTLQQLTRQVVETHARALAAHIQRPQLLTAPARNLGAT